MPDYRLATRRAARQFGVDPNILLRLIQQESGFNPHARSPAGAQGIAQFIPSTARAYGVNLNDNRVTDDLQGAARYLAANLRRTGGNYAQALSIYNSGSPTGYQRIPETRNYVRSILGGATPEAPRRGGGVGAGLQGSLTVSPGTAPGFDAGNGASDPGVLAGLLAQPQAPPPLRVQAPNSALKYLTGSGNVPVAQAPAPRVDVGALAGLLQPAEGLPEAQGQAPRVSVNVSPTATAATAGGRLRGSKLLELFYNGPGGINVKNGQREPHGFVTGHTDHVHVAAGPKTIVQVGELAQQMGLHVGENPHFGGVNPVHVKNSYHYKGEAIDVSGSPAQMRAFNRRVASLFGVGR